MLPDDVSTLSSHTLALPDRHRVAAVEVPSWGRRSSYYNNCNVLIMRDMPVCMNDSYAHEQTDDIHACDILCAAFILTRL